jgi:alpha-1,6-mannosyltransferase
LKNKYTYCILFFLGILGTILLGYFTNQNEFPKIAIGYGLMWSFYLYVIQQRERNPIWLLILMGIILRCILLPAYPPLSDDYFRFIWDGYLNMEGINPYELKPEEFIQYHGEKQYHFIYEQLNSKIYFSVYPPLLQAIFYISTWLFPESVQGSVIVMRLFLILFELGSIFFIYQILKRFSLPKWQVLLYALNPLVIIEISGNLHFEGMMIFFLMGSIYLLTKFDNIIPSAISLGLAIGAKLLPLIFIPFFLWKLGFKKAIIYGVVAGIIFLLSFFMLWDETLLYNFRESIRLYYKSFEFNGGIYYLCREIGYLFRGYNEIATIGPGLAIFSALGIIVLALLDKKKDISRLPLLFLLALSLYQLCSTTVHPWYIAPLVALASLTSSRYAIVWSGLILLTYINYSYQSYYENIWIVGLEYILVIGVLIKELIVGKRKNILPNSTN